MVQLRQQVMTAKPGEQRFAWRGKDVSRLEGFSDGVFGFAVTLLVVSLESPKSYNDLERVVAGLPAFGASFAVLLLIWFSHYLFFRRYGLQDGVTIALNAALLFLVLFYIYPLKFLYTLVMGGLLGMDPESGSIQGNQGVPLLLLFSGGFLAVFAVLTLLYVHAWRKRRELDLNEFEAYQTVTSIQYHLIYVLVSGLSISIALIGGQRFVGWAGLSFVLLGPFCGIHGWLRGRGIPPRPA